MALNKYNFLENIFRSVIIFKEYFFNKLYNVVIQVNPNQHKWITKYGVSRKKIKYIPNGISKETFDKIDNKNFIKKYNLKNKFVISYVGRIQKYKGLNQVIKVLPKLDKKIIFLVAGKDSGDKKRLIDLAIKLKVGDRIIFLGEISDKDKLRALDSSEIFILPSDWEAFGIVILEAMARNNTIISTKTEGGKFLVRKENGFTYNFGDLKKLKEIIEILFNNKKLRDTMKKNNLMKSKEFLWEDIVDDLERIYRK